MKFISGVGPFKKNHSQFFYFKKNIQSKILTLFISTLKRKYFPNKSKPKKKFGKYLKNILEV